MSEASDAASAGAVPANERVTKLFDDHADRLYRLARRLAPSADEALDLVQEVFLRVARSPRAVPHGHSQEEAWLVRVLVNLRRDQWRKAAVRRREAMHAGPPDSESPSPETSYVRRMTVWRALDALSPKRRAILVLHEIEGLSAATIASLLGITTITVRWHLARGRRELAQHIRAHTGAPHEQSDAALAGSGPAPSRSVSP